MLYNLHTIFLLNIFFFISCKNSNEPSEVVNTQTISVTTTNVNVADIYYNLLTESQVEINDNWHIGIVKDTENYNMPSFIPGDVDIAVYEDIDFNELVQIPDTFQNDRIIDHSNFSYGSSHEVLSYDISVHKVSVTNPNYVYVIISSGSAFKLQFIEYISGITVFQFANLEWED